MMEPPLFLREILDTYWPLCFLSVQDVHQTPARQFLEEHKLAVGSMVRQMCGGWPADYYLARHPLKTYCAKAH